MIKDIPPLTLAAGRWLVNADEEATLTLVPAPGLQGVELTDEWGPGERQMRCYMLAEGQLAEIHDWLGRVLGRVTAAEPGLPPRR